jgi:hypothetical protein
LWFDVSDREEVAGVADLLLDGEEDGESFEVGEAVGIGGVV